MSGRTFLGESPPRQDAAKREAAEQHAAAVNQAADLLQAHLLSDYREMESLTGTKLNDVNRSLAGLAGLVAEAQQNVAKLLQVRMMQSYSTNKKERTL